VKAIIVGAVIVSVAVIVVAENSPNSEANGGNVGRGARIAAWGTSRGVASCSSCHGYDGVGNGNSQIPRLAGQSSAYLLQQLNDFASGNRPNAYMANFAQRLSAQERADVAVYFASLESGFPPPERESAANILQRGRQLAEYGDDKLTVQSCNNCHGPQGTGEYPEIPALQGQYSSYIVGRLKRWKEAPLRDDDLMSRVASELGPDDMQAVSTYFEQLPNAHDGGIK
jgi:cytochrome c553